MDEQLLNERIATVDHRIARAITLRAEIEMLQERIKEELKLVHDRIVELEWLST